MPETAERGRPAVAGQETKITPQQAAELFRSVDRILQFVSRDTGLPIRHSVKRKLATRSQVEEYIVSRMKEDEDTQRLEQGSLVLQKFGLLPRDFDLRQYLLALLKEQVAGFYDAKTKTVYLLDWVEPEQQKPVLAHELTHALQDQNFGLDQMSKNAKKNDPTGLEADERQEANQAVLEGQGMLVMMDYMLQPTGSSVADQPQLVDAMQAGLTAPGPDTVVFNRAPMFLQQELLFPYRFGTLFERDMLVASGKQKAFAEVLRHPPATTREIMEPYTYPARTPIPPLRPLDMDHLASGYKKWDLSGVGEFDLFLLLNQYAGTGVAKNLSPAWRGGYYWAGRMLKNGKDDRSPTAADLAMVYVSRWDSAATARRFAGIYSAAVPNRYTGASPVQNEAVPWLQDAPGADADSSPLTGTSAWQTGEGWVTIEPRGDTVVVLESFDPETAKKIHAALWR